MQNNNIRTISLDVNRQKCEFIPFSGVQCVNDKQVDFYYCTQHMTSNLPLLTIGTNVAQPTPMPAPLPATVVPKQRELTDYLVQNKVTHYLNNQEGFTFDADDMKRINAAGMRLMLVPNDIDVEEEVNSDVDNSDDDGNNLMGYGQTSAQGCNYVAPFGSNKGSRCIHDKLSGYDYCAKHLTRARHVTSKLD